MSNQETLQKIIDGFAKYSPLNEIDCITEVFIFCQICKSRDGHKDDCPYRLAVEAKQAVEDDQITKERLEALGFCRVGLEGDGMYYKKGGTGTYIQLTKGKVFISAGGDVLVTKLSQVESFADLVSAIDRK